jgi:mannose-6-phosphate isomerase-like protein (cupin superfamily)
METIRKVNLDACFARFHERWNPKVVADVNDFQVKLVKLEGEFLWHHHEREDELFLVVAGRLTMRLRSGDLELGPGELVVVPHGVEHCPAAAAECQVLLFEPRSTRNTGNVENERTVRELGRV